MDRAEGKLCDTCIAALNGETKIKEWKDYFGEIGNFPFDNYHHKTYHDFAANKDVGCFICNWLWAKLPLPPGTEEGATRRSATLDGFRIYCQIHGSTVKFHAVCPWAADIELKVTMGQTMDSPPRDTYGRPGSPPPHAWTDLDAQPWSTFDDNIGSSQSLRKVKGWISSCIMGHKYCLPPGPDKGIYFPTRVIDVDKAEVGVVHLRNRNEAKAQHDDEEADGPGQRGTYPAYWTLSHRWGDPELIPQLSQTTEHQFRDGIPMDDLSPTFRDAALLVHRLGYRYIWIDSLCIFQDSLSEWQQEAKAMVDVYRHSLCNISAIAASSDPGRCRLFVKRKLQPRLLFPFKADRTLLERSGKVADRPWIFLNCSLWDDEIESTPLSTRGWVVQERFLAPRVIHFTENQIYWECLESKRCEADPIGELLVLAQEGSGRIIPTVYKKARLELAEKRAALSEGKYTSPGMERASFHSQWGDVVSLYANCTLTKESDRLIAMSGIAKTFQEVNNDKYLAGLWKELIHCDLTWTTNASDGGQVHPSKSYAPTWSWASVTGGQKRLVMLHERYGFLPKPLIKLVEERIVTEPPGGDPTGPLRSAELEIECMLYYYRWTTAKSKLAVYTDEARMQCYFEEEKKAQDLRLDTTDMVQKFAEADEMEGVCVPLCGAYHGYGGGRNVYLMLEHDSETRFKRIGVFQGGEIGKWIDGWSGEGTRITLV